MAGSLGRVGGRVLLGSTLNNLPLAVDAASGVFNLGKLGTAGIGAAGPPPGVPPGSANPAALARLERWALQSAAVAALGWADDGLAWRLGSLPERVGKCCRVPLGQVVNVDHNGCTGVASFSNLTTCGSVWACPVCAAKISERRRQELKAALARWTEKGGRALLLTLTFHHTVADALPDLLTRFARAQDLLWGGRAAEADKASWGLAGRVAALEVTRTANGWHPHGHQLLVVNPESTATIADMKAALMERWRRACIKAGLLDAGNDDELAAFERHGLDLQDGKHAARYVAKFGQEQQNNGWDLSSEVTKAHMKRGKGKSVTPWGLLRWFLETGETEPAQLFAEYAAAFKGRRQLRFSKGLRELLGLVDQEKTDEELAQERGQGSALLAALPLRAWRLVIRVGARGSLLAAAASGDAGDVWGFLERLRVAHAPEMVGFTESMEPMEVFYDAG